MYVWTTPQTQELLDPRTDRRPFLGESGSNGELLGLDRLSEQKGVRLLGRVRLRHGTRASSCMGTRSRRDPRWALGTPSMRQPVMRPTRPSLSGNPGRQQRGHGREAAPAARRTSLPRAIHARRSARPSRAKQTNGRRVSTSRPRIRGQHQDDARPSARAHLPRRITAGQQRETPRPHRLLPPREPRTRG
jgi:hypothetical protein